MSTPSDRKTNSSFHQRLTRRMMESRFFTTSLVIHLVLVSLLGGVVLFRAAQDSSNFISVGGSDGFLTEQPSEAPAAEELPQEFDEPQASSIAPAEAVAPASAISSLTESATTWSTTATTEYRAFGNSISSTATLSSGTGAGSGSGSSIGGGGGGKMGGSLFGVKIEAKKLGVVLDVSGSAHPFLIHALKEIEKSFQGSPIVLYVGCGMTNEAPAKAYEVKRARSLSDEFEKPPHGVSVFALVGTWTRLNPNDADYIKRLLRNKDVFATVADAKTPPTTGCQFAFEKLIEEQVDTIYWFADFTDKIDPAVVEELAGKLQAKKIKVIAHNFAGKPIHPAAMPLVSLTGGQAITAIPGK